MTAAVVVTGPRTAVGLVGLAGRRWRGNGSGSPTRSNKDEDRDDQPKRQHRPEPDDEATPRDRPDAFFFRPDSLAAQLRPRRSALSSPRTVPMAQTPASVVHGQRGLLMNHPPDPADRPTPPATGAEPNAQPGGHLKRVLRPIHL